jgi:uncharacterized protein (TIGR02246 family)
MRCVCLCAFTLTSMLALIGCQIAPQPEQNRDVGADTRAINALIDQYTAAHNSNDVAANVAIFADDAIVMMPDQAAIEGKQAIRSFVEAAFKERTYKIVPTPLETQVAGDWAYVRVNFTGTVTPKSGKPMEISYKFLWICRRQPDSSWKIYRVILNSNNPPPSAAGKKK